MEEGSISGDPFWRTCSISVIDPQLKGIAHMFQFNVESLKWLSSREVAEKKETGRLVRNLALVGMFLCAVGTESLPIILRTPNSAMWWVVGGTLMFLGLVLFVPFLRDLFKFEKLHSVDIVICLAAGAVSILWFECLKVVRNRRLRSTVHSQYWSAN